MKGIENTKFSHLIDWRDHNKDIGEFVSHEDNQNGLLGTPMAVKYCIDFNSGYLRACLF